MNNHVVVHQRLDDIRSWRSRARSALRWCELRKPYNSAFQATTSHQSLSTSCVVDDIWVVVSVASSRCCLCNQFQPAGPTFALWINIILLALPSARRERDRERQCEASRRNISWCRYCCGCCCNSVSPAADEPATSSYLSHSTKFHFHSPAGSFSGSWGCYQTYVCDDGLLLECLFSSMLHTEYIVV